MIWNTADGFDCTNLIYSQKRYIPLLILSDLSAHINLYLSRAGIIVRIILKLN